jgi:hypothetical protein
MLLSMVVIGLPSSPANCAAYASNVMSFATDVGILGLMSTARCYRPASCQSGLLGPSRGQDRNAPRRTRTFGWRTDWGRWVQNGTRYVNGFNGVGGRPKILDIVGGPAAVGSK